MLTLMKKFLSLCIVVALAGCSVLREVDVVTAPVALETPLRAVFVATDRAGTAGDPLSLARGAGRDRAGGLGLGRVDVTVPPGHVPGRMEWARAGQWHPKVHFTARRVVG